MDLDNAKYYAGHSLGEYSALCAANYLSFSDTIKLLKIRGDAMQNAVPKGEGGMLAVLGSKVEIIEDLLSENKNNFIAEIANDNSEGQIVLSGRNSDIDKLIHVLKSKNIIFFDLYELEAGWDDLDLWDLLRQVITKLGM